MRVAVAVVVAVMLAVGPGGASTGQAGQVAQGQKCDVCASHGVSKAVVNGAFDAVHRFQVKFERGEARAGDAQAVVTGLRILFAHLDEVGVTKAMEHDILAREEEVVRYVATRADAAKVHEQHTRLGINSTVDEVFESMSRTTVNERREVMERIRKGGMKVVYEQIVAAFENLQVKLAKAERDGRQLQLREVTLYQCRAYEAVAVAMAIPCVFGCSGCCLIAAVAKVSQYLCELSGGVF